MLEQLLTRMPNGSDLKTLFAAGDANIKDSLIIDAAAISTDVNAIAAQTKTLRDLRTEKAVRAHFERLLSKISGRKAAVCREVMRLRYIDGLNWISIASKTGLTRKQVLKYHSIAIQKMGVTGDVLKKLTAAE